jgi:trehalose/maltose hydrolase-like predicted phosphorylase
MGYSWDPELIPRNVAYYLARTSHGSTLSRVVHAWVLARSDRRASWRLFQEALASDIDDIQGGTTSEGIHMGAMAGSVDLVQRCFTGLAMRDEVLWFNPQLPEELPSLRLALRYRGRRLQLSVSQEELEIAVEDGDGPAVRVGVRDEVHELQPGRIHRFDLTRESTR